MKSPTSQPDDAVRPASKAASAGPAAGEHCPKVLPEAERVVRGVPRMPRHIGPEEGLRFYAAILGRRPQVDPDAPDLLPRWPASDDPPQSRNWHGHLRDELGRALHLPGRRKHPPTWAELLDQVTTIASRQLDQARRRLAPAVNSAAARIASARSAASRPLAESSPPPPPDAREPSGDQSLSLDRRISRPRRAA